MIRHSKILLMCIAMSLCLSALAIFPVSAGHGTDTDNTGDPAQRMENCLLRLEEQGIDATEIQAAFVSGDKDTVHQLVTALRDEGIIGNGEGHDVASDVDSGGNECGRDRTGELKRKEQLEEHIEMINENGIDVTDIRTALELGDMDAVRAILEDIHEECTVKGTETSDFKGLACMERTIEMSNRE